MKKPIGLSLTQSDTSPVKRLRELEKQWNDLENDQVTPTLLDVMKAIKEEIREIQIRFPEVGPVNLKIYNMGMKVNALPGTSPPQ